jgi:hypothetical protein
VVLSHSAGVFVVWPLRKNTLRMYDTMDNHMANDPSNNRQEFFLNCHTAKTPAEGESTTGCMYNLDLLTMGL